MSKELTAQLRNAAEDVRNSIRSVEYQGSFMARCRTEWPALWNRLDRLVAVVETIQKREQEETGRASGW